MEQVDQIEMCGKMAVALDLIEGCAEFTALIPEVRTNLVYALPKAKTRDDVLAVDGRITVVRGLPHAAGKPRFGASSHMARLLVELRKTDSTLRAAVNFASNPALAQWLEEYCRSKEWIFSVIDRRNEPEEIKQTEGASMPWKVQAAIEAAGGVVPKVFYETGAVGKEPVSVLVGLDPIDVAEEICEIARRYHGRS
ncbi:MAG: thiamine-phosphate synthase family protein [Halobacteriota archaeon]|jgi:hydroxymethylpyrimidine/phosphomethylpyrimidine kinase